MVDTNQAIEWVSQNTRPENYSTILGKLLEKLWQPGFYEIPNAFYLGGFCLFCGVVLLEKKNTLSGIFFSIMGLVLIALSLKGGTI